MKKGENKDLQSLINDAQTEINSIKNTIDGISSDLSDATLNLNDINYNKISNVNKDKIVINKKGDDKIDNKKQDESKSNQPKWLFEGIIISLTFSLYDNILNPFVKCICRGQQLGDDIFSVKELLIYVGLFMLIFALMSGLLTIENKLISFIKSLWKKLTK